MKALKSGLATVALLGSLGACSVADTGNADPAPRAKGGLSEACSSTDAETGELLPGAKLVQLDLQLR
ncbi:MAG: hypothetical protein ABIP44_12125, partial [Pseudoxanthomonas sp.]